jgi:predicted nucleotidyltransferase
VEPRLGPDPVAVDFARQARERLGPRVRQVVLFGSRARGDARDDSDYDDVVVVDRRSRDVRETLLEIEIDILDRYGSLVACLLRDEREWAASQGLPIGLNVAREGIAL